jgi:hypothetical protein
VVIDKNGPFVGLDKAINDRFSEFWFDEEAEREFMEVSLFIYGPVLRLRDGEKDSMA